MSDLATTLITDPNPATTEAQPPTVATSPGDGLPQGIHPRDNSVPLVPGQPIDADTPISGDHLGPQGFRTMPPWSTPNEQAVPVNQRSASEWSANGYTLNDVTGPIQLSGKRKGQTSVLVWVPSGASLGVVISPNEGDITQGAGIELDPGDSIELNIEAAVWGGVIPGQSTGSVNVVVLFNPPGGGLGLSAG